MVAGGTVIVLLKIDLGRWRVSVGPSPRIGLRREECVLYCELDTTLLMGRWIGSNGGCTSDGHCACRGRQSASPSTRALRLRAFIVTLTHGVEVFAQIISRA